MPANISADITLRDVLRILRRHRRIVVVVAVVCFSVAVFYSVIAKRRYSSSSLVELKKSEAGTAALDSLMGGLGGGGEDSLSVNVDVSTQVNILKSERLALAVINKLHLEKTPDFQRKTGILDVLLGYFGGGGPQDAVGASLEDSPRRREKVVAIFQKNLKVKGIAGTRLIEIDYENPDPRIAAAVANDIVKELINFNFQVRFQATTDASKWLEVQLADLRNQTTDLQARVVAVQKETGLFGMGGNDLQGRPMVYSPTLDRLQQATVELSKAQSNRILKGAVYQAAKEGNAELLSQLSGTGIGDSASPGVANSFNLVQNLRGQQASLQGQIQQLSVKYGPNYPKLVELRASLDRLDRSLDEEIHRLEARAKNDFEVAQQSEAGSKKLYDQAQAEASHLNDKTIEFSILQREANESQDLYQDMLKRLKEAGVIEGLHSSNLSLVDIGRVAARPSVPNVPIILLVGASVGLFVGVLAALLQDAIDNLVRGTEEIEAFGYPVIGLVPHQTKEEEGKSTPILEVPRGSYSEAIRGVRSSILLSRGGAPPKVVLVTSGSPAEGKSTLSVNIAIAFAQQRSKVLLIETDMRRPTLRQRLAIQVKSGLSQLLSQEHREFAVSSLSNVPNLDILTAGPIPPDPSELLSSSYFGQFIENCKKNYDFVVIDTAPVLPVADTRLIVPCADLVLLVVRSEVTTRPSLQRSYKLLQQHSGRSNTPIAILLNAVPPTSAAYYEYYGYARAYNYYKESEL